MSNIRHLARAASVATLLAPVIATPVGSWHPNEYQRSASYSYQQSVAWQNCTEEFLQLPVVPPGLQCANLTVPLNWDNPHGKTITLGMSKLPATNQSTKLGELIINPGGPGGIATQDVAYIALGYGWLSPELLAHYDIIGPDPRGIGASSGLQCDVDIWNERVSYFPNDTASFNKLIEHNRALGESCLNETGDLLYHMDTISVAKDMEAVRIALGMKKFNYLGLSYGTQIGSQYAELYPKTVGRVVLDGNVDHSQPETSALVTEVSTFEQELDRFFIWCQSNTTCALHGQDVAALFDELVANATESPLPAPGCDGSSCRIDVTWDELIANVQDMLVFKTLPSPYDELNPTWADLGAALALAATGNATALSTTLGSGWQGFAVGCVDWLHASKSLSDLKYKNTLTASIAPHTKGVSQTYSYQAGCLHWPAPVINPNRLLDVSPAVAPILLVNSLYDPETSMVWAEGLRKQIPNSVLLTRNGDGHTSYMDMGEASVVVDAFFINGTLPAQNTIVDS